MDNLADRFEISAARWARAIEAVEHAYPILKGSLDDEVSWGLSLDREEQAVTHAGARLLADQAITTIRLDLFDLQDACESPIEWPMMLALMIVARHHGASVKVVAPRGGEYGDRFEPTSSPRFPEYFLRIEPQAVLGEHRVDLLLTLDGSIRQSDGRLRSGSKRMVIECDGHDFHERTKAQAKHDRQRDRLLQSFGFLVYRFTGQEIWEDVFACAAQAIDSLIETVREQLQA